jgi:hypothetical protein
MYSCVFTYIIPLYVLYNTPHMKLCTFVCTYNIPLCVLYTDPDMHMFVHIRVYVHSLFHRVYCIPLHICICMYIYIHYSTVCCIPLHRCIHTRVYSTPGPEIQFCQLWTTPQEWRKRVGTERGHILFTKLAVCRTHKKGIAVVLFIEHVCICR